MKIENKKHNLLKIIIIVTIILFVTLAFVIIRNDKTKLTCVRTNDTISVNAIEKYTAKFKDGNLSILKTYYKQNLNHKYLDKLDKVYDNFLNYVTNLEKDGGYSYTIKKGNDYVFYDATIDINEIPDSSKYIIGYNNTWTYKDVKADLERNNFKCK